MRFCLLFFLLLCFAQELSAQQGNSQTADSLLQAEITPEADTTTGNKHTLVEPDTLKGTKQYQHSDLALHPFDTARWNKVVEGETFDESREKEEKRQATASDRNVPWAADALSLTAYVIIIAIIVLIIYYVSKNVLVPTQLKKKLLPSEEFVATEENMEALDLNHLLGKALADGNLRMAIRIYYLRLLKKLDQQGLIAWKKDKTNRDYLGELMAGKTYFDEFRLLTGSYERVWYGEHVLTNDSFQKLAKDFERIDQRLNV
jgi:hypothetical protein